MKKILLLENNDLGLYKRRRELIQQLLDKKYKVFISTPYGEYIPLLENMGCSYIEIEYNRAGKNPLKELQLLSAYHRLIRKGNFDMVLLYTIKPTLYAGLICRIKKIPYLTNITGLSAIVTDTKILKHFCFILYRLVLKHSNMVFFQNKSNLELFVKKGIVTHNGKLIPGSGVNLKEHTYETYIEEETLRILYVGRIAKVKGMDEWIDAMELLNEQYNDLIFEIVGECDKPYQEKIQHLHEQKKLIYYGVSPTPHEYMKRTHAVIMPSYGEGMSNVLLEAAACGRPILASDVPGCREIVIDGVTGFRFEPHSVNSILDAIKKFRKLSKEQRKQMGTMGREHVVKHFSREIVIDEYMKEIGKVCGEDQK